MHQTSENVMLTGMLSLRAAASDWIGFGISAPAGDAAPTMMNSSDIVVGIPTLQFLFP